MPLPTDPLYYTDCYDLYQRALKAPAGVQKVCESKESAETFRHRLHKARVINRAHNARAFTKDNPMHNVSEYYKITITIVEDKKRGKWLLQLRQRVLIEEEIEEIPYEGETKPQFEALPLPGEPHEALDDFDLAPEEDLGTSPPSRGRDSRF
jgi:hypothetical protein